MHEQPLSPDVEQRAQETIRRYAGAAFGLVAYQHPALLSELSAICGVPITAAAVARSLRAAGLLRYATRAALADGLRVLGIVTRSSTLMLMNPAAYVACPQTWELGHLALTIARNSGRALGKQETLAVLGAARHSFDARLVPIVAQAAGR